MENNKTIFHFEMDEDGIDGKVQGDEQSLVFLFCQIFEHKPEVKDLFSKSLQAYDFILEKLEKKKKVKKTPKHVN
jgi:hypothetical protein